MPRTQRTSQNGFTIVELTLSIGLSIIVVTVFVSILFSSLFSTNKNRAQLELNSTNQVALDFLERDIRFSTAFMTGIDTANFSDPYAPSGGWSYKGSSASVRTLVLSGYATNKSTFSPDRQNIFQNTASIGCGASSYTLNPQLPYQTIYFVSSGTLYRRIITNTSLPVCTNNGTQAQKQSCPRNLASPNAVCLALDEVILTNVTQFTIDYYDDASDTTAMDVYNSTDSAILVDASAASISVTTQQSVDQKPVTSTIALRTTRLN